MAKIQNRKINNAKKSLLHYFQMIANKAGIYFDYDCETEIQGIIDDIVDGIIEEMRDKNETNNRKSTRNDE